jgi:hypothetical protein
MRFEHVLRAPAGVGRGTADAHVGELTRHRIERAKWCPWHGQPISTAFVESAVNEIVARRMIKKQQMHWNRWTVQPFLDVRTAVLNGTLEGAFRQCYPDFHPPAATLEPRPWNPGRCMSLHDFACSQPRA